MKIVRVLLCNASAKPVEVQLPVTGTSILCLSLNSHTMRPYTLCVGEWIKVNGHNKHQVSLHDNGSTITLSA